MKEDISNQFTIDEDGNVTYHGDEPVRVDIERNEYFDENNSGRLVYKIDGVRKFECRMSSEGVWKPIKSNDDGDFLLEEGGIGPGFEIREVQ